jgi:hypothetical protein
LHRWAHYRVQITERQICALWDMGLVEERSYADQMTVSAMRLVRGVTRKQALAALAVAQVPRHLGALHDLGLVETRGCHADDLFKAWWQTIPPRLRTKGQRKADKHRAFRLKPGVTREQCMAALAVRNDVSGDGAIELSYSSNVGAQFRVGAWVNLASVGTIGRLYQIVRVDGNKMWVK